MNKNLAGIGRRTFRGRWRGHWSTLREWLLEDQARKGLGGPPNNWQTSGYFTIDERAPSTTVVRWRWARSISFGNDAFEIWISDKEEQEGKTLREDWEFHCRTEHFRKMALWYLWRWAWGEWFGLRRWLYYKDLHRRCEKFGEHIAEVAKLELEKQWEHLVKDKQDAANGRLP